MTYPTDNLIDQLHERTKGLPAGPERTRRLIAIVDEYLVKPDLNVFEVSYLQGMKRGLSRSLPNPPEAS
jgi:hypothetical protein